MKLIIIYGQEATGKLTIAKALAEKTGYKLFHNHLSVDVARSLYEYGEPSYDELLVNVRLAAFESAARHQLDGVIFTWAYTHPQCFDQLQRIIQTIKPYDAELHLVHVYCSQEAMEARVISPDRTQLGKIDDVKGLHRQQQRKNCIAIPGLDSLVIDNTLATPERVAEQIITYYQRT